MWKSKELSGFKILNQFSNKIGLIAFYFILIIFILNSFFFVITA